MKIGFTGTRHGMTPPQLAAAEMVIAEFGTGEFHHGDCIGSDDEAARIAHRTGWFVIVSHPPSRDEFRAFFLSNHAVRSPKSYFERNRDIVDETEILIAAPSVSGEVTGGTGYTMKYAKSKGKHVIRINPDGSIVDSRGGYWKTPRPPPSPEPRET